MSRSEESGELGRAVTTDRALAYAVLEDAHGAPLTGRVPTHVRWQEGKPTLERTRLFGTQDGVATRLSLYGHAEGGRVLGRIAVHQRVSPRTVVQVGEPFRIDWRALALCTQGPGCTEHAEHLSIGIGRDRQAAFEDVRTPTELAIRLLRELFELPSDHDALDVVATLVRTLGDVPPELLIALDAALASRRTLPPTEEAGPE